MTATAVRTGWRVECRPCGAVTVWPEAGAQAYWDKHPRDWACYLPCRSCGRGRFCRPISGRAGKRPCGAWCTEGTGTKCVCECGGRNHGAAYPPGVLWALR